MIGILISFAIAQTVVSSTPPNVQVGTTPTVEFCRETFEHVLTDGTGVYEQLIHDVDEAKLVGDPRAEQIGVCSVYFRGMMDLLASQAPKA